MALGHFLQKQSVIDKPFTALNFNEATMRFESAMSSLVKASNILSSVMKFNLNDEETRLAHHQLSTIPAEYSTGLRLEAYQTSTQGLKYRAEGIIDTIIESISKFFKWIGEAFSKLFGGGESEAGPKGAGAATSANTEVIETASSNGLDEFLFKENSPLFKHLDLNDLPRCYKYQEAIAISTRVMVDLNKKSIELSKGASKEYKGEFDKDVVTTMKEFASKTPAYCKEQVGSSIQGDYFAFPLDFLRAGTIQFETNTIKTNGATNDAPAGKGYTPKDVYIKTHDWKKLVDVFGNTSKVFFDCGNDIKKLAEEYKGLETKAREWRDMEPNEVKRVGDGVRELNKVASFVYSAIKQQEKTINALSAMLKTVAENDLRKQAQEGREKEKADAEAEAKKKKEEEEAQKAANNAAPATPPAPAPAA